MQLNSAQNEAVRYVQGPCLVLAGAGSGKTRVITAKIVSLIRNCAVPPNRICALTFTNKAAAEMRERAARDLTPEVASRLWISTFHSLGLEILRIEHNSFHLTRNFSLFDEYDSKKVLRDILRDEFAALLRGNSESELIDTAQQSISLWKGKLLSPEQVEDKAWTKDIYFSYVRYLQACNAVDFDDLIFLPALKLRQDDRLYQKWSRCFYYVLVDEYQDTNETQYNLLQILVSGSKRFTVVGDDDQSIYSWRGARPENISVLASDYPDLKVIKLEQNYRSSNRILRNANHVIANNDHLFAKSLFSEHQEGPLLQIYECASEDNEGQTVCELIKALQFQYRLKWSDIAVLYRSNFQSRYIERYLNAARIPCEVTGGSSFFSLSEVKDMLAWCRVIANPQDDSALLRIINVPRRGIGTETLQVLTECARNTRQSLYSCAMSQALNQRLGKAQRQAVGDFLILATKLRSLLLSHQDLQLALQLPELTGYETYLRSLRENKASVQFHLDNARQLCQWVAELIHGKNGEPPLSFAKAVEKLGLREMMSQREDNSEHDAVQLMTLHASKGLEFPAVFMLGMEEGILPHQNSLEEGNASEERRLCYVGITRAQRFLTFSLCKQRRRNNEIILPKPSRFLGELIETDVQKHQSTQQVSWEDAEARQRIEQNVSAAISSLKDLLK